MWSSICLGGMIVLGLGAALVLCLGMRGKCDVAAAPASTSMRRASRSVAGDRPLDVVINEVAWMGTAASDWDEWIELYNNTSSDIDLTGWTLTSTGSVRISVSGTIAAHSYYLIERNDEAVGDISADQVYGGDHLSNDGEILYLRDSLGYLIDTANTDLGHGSGWAAGANNPEFTMERVDPTAPDATDNWATNDGSVRNGVDRSGTPIDGTPRARNASCAIPDLSVRYLGPDQITPGTVFSTRILVSNTADLTLSGLVVTGKLAPGLDLVAQESPFSFVHSATDTLIWDVGTLPTGAVGAITVTLRLSDTAGGTLVNVITAADGGGRVGTAVWAAVVVPHVRIYALHPCALRSSDEGLALANLGPVTISLAGWGISDGDVVPDAVMPAVTLPPGDVIWIADQADAFVASFGFAPDLAMSWVTSVVPVLSGKWPGFANGGDEAVLYEDGGRRVDVLVYGQGTSSLDGWGGRPVAFPRAGFSSSGQILYRRLDELTGLTVADTDTATDWANDTAPGDVLYGPVHAGDLYGKRVAYPGWDWDAYTDTFEISSTAVLTVAVAPDNAYEVVAGFLNSAQKSIAIEGYSFESVWLTGILTERIAAGVQVTMLLEGSEVSDIELWNCKQVVEAGGRVHFMHNDTLTGVYDRYTNQHAKFIVVDGARVAVSSENLTNRSLPVDDKANGTAGSRGVTLITDQRDIVDYVAALFARDCDPVHHNDIVAYGALPRYTVLPTYTAVFSTGGGGYDYMAPFSVPVSAFETDHLEVVHSPETSLRYGDGLIGLVLRAGVGDEVYVEQMYERLHWGPASSSTITDPNPRLEAYIQAARQGARVRILLDTKFDGERENYETAFYILDVARQEGLDLDVRLGNPTVGGIHNKMVLVKLADRGYVHVGSINGSEASSKVNRELALQARSSGAYAYLYGVWEYDWAHSGGPYQTYLPLVSKRYVAESNHVLISEVVFKQGGSGDEYGEWIELYNPTAAAIDISGWYLGDAVAAGDYERLYAFPAGTIIAAQGTLVIARRATAYQSFGYTHKPVPDFEWNHSSGVPDLILTRWGDGECALGNTGDEVLLLDGAGHSVDVVAYGTGGYPGVVSFHDADMVYNGNSLERWPANRDSDDCGIDFRVRYVPDPGSVQMW